MNDILSFISDLKELDNGIQNIAAATGATLGSIESSADATRQYLWQFGDSIVVAGGGNVPGNVQSNGVLAQGVDNGPHTGTALLSSIAGSLQEVATVMKANWLPHEAKPSGNDQAAKTNGATGAYMSVNEKGALEQRHQLPLTALGFNPMEELAYQLGKVFGFLQEQFSTPVEALAQFGEVLQLVTEDARRYNESLKSMIEENAARNYEVLLAARGQGGDSDQLNETLLDLQDAIVQLNWWISNMKTGKDGEESESTFDKIKDGVEIGKTIKDGFEVIKWVLGGTGAAGGAEGGIMALGSKAGIWGTIIAAVAVAGYKIYKDTEPVKIPEYHMPPLYQHENGRPYTRKEREDLDRGFADFVKKMPSIKPFEAPIESMRSPADVSSAPRVFVPMELREKNVDIKPKDRFGPLIGIDPPPPAPPKKNRKLESHSEAIIGGGQRVVTINMNAPMYKVEKQVFQNVADAIKDFEPRVQEALWRILRTVPA